MQEEHVVRASVQLSPGGPVKEFRKSFHENNKSFRDCVNEIRTEILDYYGENLQGNPQGVCVCVFKLKGHLHSFNEFEHCRSVDFDDQDLEEKEEEEDPDEKKQKTR